MRYGFLALHDSSDLTRQLIPLFFLKKLPDVSSLYKKKEVHWKNINLIGIPNSSDIQSLLQMFYVALLLFYK